VKQRPLTLIEVLVVLSILSIVGSFVVFGIQNAKQKQLFLNESELVLKATQLSQDLMLMLNADVSLKFKEGDKSIIYSIEVQGAEKDPFIKELGKGKHLRAIHVVEFDGDQEEKELTLSFLSNGSSMPKGVFRLSTVKQEQESRGLTRYITLPGYPDALRMSSARSEESDQDDALIRYTMDEVQSLTAGSTP